MVEIARGYLDLQVNGYMGVDFNATDLTVEQLRYACEALSSDGVDGVLATIITDQPDAMLARLTTIATACAGDPLIARVVRGIHIEGPFISDRSGYVGAHPPAAVRAADLDLAKRLLDAAGGLTRIVTLAPEQDPTFQLTRYLSNQGIVVSAGHCDPSYDQLLGATDAGLSMFTHLGNGCPADMHRHDNIVQRVLALAGRIWVSFIGDGVHVPYFALRNYLQLVGLQRAVIVTDAISAAGQGAGQFEVAGKPVVVDELGVTRYPGVDSHFVGSAATMPQIVERLGHEVGLDRQELQQLVCDNPRQIIGWG